MELSVLRDQMHQVLEMFQDDLATLKTGRATPALVEKVMVEAYETKMPLVELATITAPIPNQLLITPFDQAVVKNIERALSVDRNLGLSSVVDKNVIRVSIPPLTEERRRELVKVLGQKLEAAKVMLRGVRRDRMVEIKRRFETKELNEDEKFKEEEEVQKLTDEFNEKVREAGGRKETELLTV